MLIVYLKVKKHECFSIVLPKTKSRYKQLVYNDFLLLL